MPPQRQMDYNKRDSREFAIYTLYATAMWNPFKSRSIVINPTMEPYFILLSLTLPSCPTCYRKLSNESLHTCSASSFKLGCKSLCKSKPWWKNVNCECMKDSICRRGQEWIIKRWLVNCIIYFEYMIIIKYNIMLTCIYLLTWANLWRLLKMPSPIFLIFFFQTFRDFAIIRKLIFFS